MGDADTILVSGATGLVGGRWLRRLAPETRVRMLTRRAGATAPGAPEPVVWNGTDVPEAAVAGVRAVVHLSGEPIFGGIPTAARKQRMVDSRVDSTASIVAAIGGLPSADRPEVLVCASAVGIYGDRGEEGFEPLAPGCRNGPVTAAFVELPLLWPPARAQWTLEVERANGTRMRVRLQGGSASDLLALGRLLWSAER